MNLPGFTAQASLYKTSNRYSSLAFDHTSPQRTVLVPQLGGPDFEGRDNCISDCRDSHPAWSIERCGRACNDPATTQGSGSGQTRDAASIALCWTGYGLCSAVGFAEFRPDLWASCLFGGPCSCEEVRDSCLSN